RAHAGDGCGVLGLHRGTGRAAPGHRRELAPLPGADKRLRGPAGRGLLAGLLAVPHLEADQTRDGQHDHDDTGDPGPPALHHWTIQPDGVSIPTMESTMMSG